MEILAVVLGILAIIGYFFEVFSLVNYLQFFRGKTTWLEKISVKKSTSDKGVKKESKK